MRALAASEPGRFVSWDDSQTTKMAAIRMIWIIFLRAAVGSSPRHPDGYRQHQQLGRPGWLAVFHRDERLAPCLTRHEVGAEARFESFGAQPRERTDLMGCGRTLTGWQPGWQP